MRVRLVSAYRLHSTTGDDLGVIQHSAPNVQPGDVVRLRDGHDAIVTARVETGEAAVEALLEVAVAPSAPALPPAPPPRRLPNSAGY